MNRWLPLVAITALTIVSGCGLRGDLYLEEPEGSEVSSDPNVDPSFIDQAEAELDATDISDPDLLETEAEASSDELE